ncbi:hypothetical protein BHM03_00042617 [Ensete ventricosum]|nr:hypothetical protein BHM03_00042617 [Ensete ventricosum]
MPSSALRFPSLPPSLLFVVGHLCPQRTRYCYTNTTDGAEVSVVLEWAHEPSRGRACRRGELFPFSLVLVFLYCRRCLSLPCFVRKTRIDAWLSAMAGKGGGLTRHR